MVSTGNMVSPGSMVSTSSSAMVALLMLGVTLLLVTDESIYPRKAGEFSQEQMQKLELVNEELAMMTGADLKKAQAGAKMAGFCQKALCEPQELAAWFRFETHTVSKAVKSPAKQQAATDASTQLTSVSRAGSTLTTADVDAIVKTQRLASTQLSQSGMLAIVHAVRQMSLKVWGAAAGVIGKNCPKCKLCRDNSTCAKMGDSHPCVDCVECANCMFVHPLEWGTKDPQFQEKNRTPPPAPIECVNNICASCPDCKECVANQKFTLACAPCWKCRDCAPYWTRCPTAAAPLGRTATGANESAANSSDVAAVTVAATTTAPGYLGPGISVY